jgi:hypothetical protein
MNALDTGLLEAKRVTEIGALGPGFREEKKGRWKEKAREKIERGER